MNESATAQRLSKAIEQAARSAKFCVAGSLPGADPGWAETVNMAASFDRLAEYVRTMATN